MSETTYDVIVLGGGGGGVPAAIRSAQLGGRVALIESGDMGGFCMNNGCIPFGHMMEASNILGHLSTGESLGLNIPDIPRDYAALSKKRDELVSMLNKGPAGLLRKNKVVVIKGKGEITGKEQITVNNKILSYKNLILATGAEWVQPDFPGAELDEVINSDALLKMDKVPERVLLYGKSPWLIEIAQLLNRFGSQVTLATKEISLLANESEEISSRITNTLKKQGIQIKARAEIQSVKKEKDGLHSTLSVKGKEEAIVVDRIVTLERKASLKGLGLTTAGLDESSEYIKTDAHMETTIKGIYAIGDVSAPEKQHYSHLAFTGGVVAAENAMGNDRSLEPASVARVIFCQPQIASVGLTVEEAEEAGHDVAEGAAPLSMNPAGRILSQTTGIIEIVSEKKYGEILGVHIIGERACEIAGQAILAMQMEGTLEDLARATFPHPTLSESLGEAARDALGQALYLP
ncbi:dihydrolipoyl dehydrogenase family protein [Thermodesulfobacteriota bacterium]